MCVEEKRDRKDDSMPSTATTFSSIILLRFLGFHLVIFLWINLHPYCGHVNNFQRGVFNWNRAGIVVGGGLQLVEENASWLIFYDKSLCKLHKLLQLNSTTTTTRTEGRHELSQFHAEQFHVSCFMHWANNLI